MQQSRPAIRFNFKRLEHPWLVRQTATHLIFGFFARRVPLVYAALVGGVALVACSFFVYAQARHDYVDAILPLFGVGFALYAMGQASRLQQAIVGWVVTKFTLLIVTILFLAVFVPMNFRTRAPDRWPDLALALIWIPSIEFLPAVTPRQRHLTLARFLLTIPCVYFGITSGNWHW